MYFVVAGGGEVGFHLAKALLESGHEIMVIESDRRRAAFIEEQLGSVVLNAPADEGRFQMEAGCQRADAVIAVTGEDPVNLIICQLAKWKCNVPRVIARVNDPKNEIIFKALGMSDETARERFGFFLEALEYGTPQHGGIASGIERLMMALVSTDNIRDVMAFPKTASAADLMIDAPGEVDASLLAELRVRVAEE